ncbi:MAG: DUF2804 family protein [Bacteroidia bacterium]|nr:DUF2804 family protein [Bacteroidia bacterium]
MTRNQSEDQNKYNENLIWKEDGNSLLPPVRVSRTPESRDFSGSGIWHVRDDHHMVNVDFIVRNQISFVINAGLIKADYYISFGELKGWVRQENGRKIVLDGMVGIGEDKSMNF